LSPAQIIQALADWGLSEQADQHPFTLSMGQKRRLALALLTETDRWPFLILDEPTTGLDWRATEHITAQIRRLAASGRALAVITHDADFALSVCHRIALLDQGGVAAMGPAPEILCDAPLLDSIGLAPPETAPLVHRMQAAPC
jgi:energy-coupling factor transport system ATP-binding protein